MTKTTGLETPEPVFPVERLVGQKRAPEMATWINGKPDNLEAAAADAYHWFVDFYAHNGERAVRDFELRNLIECMDNLQPFLWPNAERELPLKRQHGGQL